MASKRLREIASSPEFTNAKDDTERIRLLGQNEKFVTWTPEEQSEALNRLKTGSVPGKVAPSTTNAKNEEQSWLARNAGDFVDNTPLALLKDPSITDKTQFSSPAVGGLSHSGGWDAPLELLAGGIYTIPRDIIKGIYGAGEKLFEGDPGAALGQTASLALPKVAGGVKSGLRRSAVRNMQEVMLPHLKEIPESLRLGERMLDDFDVVAMSAEGLLEKLGEQKSQRLDYTKGIENQLADARVSNIDTLSSIGDFIDQQGEVPVGRHRELANAGRNIAKEATELFYDKIPGKTIKGQRPSILDETLSGAKPTPDVVIPDQYAKRDVRFSDLLKGKQGWGQLADEAFEKPSVYNDPEVSAKAEAGKAAWRGAKTTLDELATEFEKSQTSVDDNISPGKYAESNLDIADLIKLEHMIARSSKPGTLLGSLPNRVMGWLFSPIAGRVLGGELGARVPESIPFNTTSGHIKDILGKGLDPLARLTPEQIAIINNMQMEDENAF